MTDDDGVKTGSLHPGGGGSTGSRVTTNTDPLEDLADLVFDEDTCGWQASITIYGITLTKYGNSRADALNNLRSALTEHRAE